jgi:hypothetical protein
MEFAILDIHSILTAKLGAFYARASSTDLDDLEFLGLTFPEEIHQLKHALSHEHRKACITGFMTKYGGPSNTDQVRQMKHVFWWT